MTYLECVNAVLKRLRETTVSTVDETTYSSLVGSIVNDSKREIEDAHQWSALRSTISFPTVASQLSYSLTDCKQDGTIILEVLDDTNNHYLAQATRRYLNDSLYISSSSTGIPSYFVFNGTDGNNDLQIDLLPKPSGIFTIRVDLVKPQAELTSDATIITVPGNCVRDLAIAYANAERGESGGISGSESMERANMTLANAIAIDANRYGKELVWNPV